jgi:hypothetical protein
MNRNILRISALGLLAVLAVAGVAAAHPHATVTTFEGKARCYILTDSKGEENLDDPLHPTAPRVQLWEETNGVLDGGVATGGPLDNLQTPFAYGQPFWDVIELLGDPTDSPDGHSGLQLFAENGIPADTQFTDNPLQWESDCLPDAPAM